MLKVLGENDMKKEDLRRMLFVLGKEHCLDVMICVYKNGWQTASQVARDLNIHIATAVKYLSELHELDFVDRRIKKGKTREAYEYHLKTPKIKIELDISQLMDKSSQADKKPLVLFSILYTILMKSRKVVGHSVDTYVNGRFEDMENSEKKVVMDLLLFDGDLEDAKDIFIKNINGSVITQEKFNEVISVLSDIINWVIEHYESRLGHHSTESLVEVTMNKVIRSFGGDIISDNKVLNTLPYDYCCTTK